MDQDEDFQQPSESDLAALASQMPSFEMLESTTPIADDSPAPEETQQQDDAEGSFEFNLFSRSTVSKVDLKQDQTPAYAVTVRPSSYYSHTPTPQQVEEFRQAAIDYDMIVAQSQIPWPFCRRPERELHLARDGTRIGASKNEKQTTTTRWRPSKARRRKFKELKAAETARQERLARMKKTSWRTGPTKPKASADAGAKTARKPPVAKSGPAGGYPRKGAPPV